MKRIDLSSRAVTTVFKTHPYQESSIRYITLGPAPIPPSKKKKKQTNMWIEEEQEVERFVTVYATYGIGELKCWDMTPKVFGKQIHDSFLGNTDVVNCMIVDKDRLYTGGEDK